MRWSRSKVSRPPAPIAQIFSCTTTATPPRFRLCIVTSPKPGNHDTFGPLGPFIVPKEFVKDPTNIRHTFTLNGDVMQDSNTSRMDHNVYELLHYASNILTLNPGDIISGGSPAGTNIERAEPRWMRAGDTAQCSIEGIGVQKHAVVAESAATN